MFYELNLAWRNVMARPVQTAIALLVVALATALFVTLIHLNEGLQRGIIRASDPFGVLVVGAKGSAQQLVLSTLLLQGVPVGNIPGEIYARLATDPRARLAVPIALGDNVGGARIIGSNSAFFELRSTESAPPAFQLAQGRSFRSDFEAVLGSKTAEGLGLRIGDQFRAGHGVEEGLEDDVHDDAFTVVGVLQPSNTPFDAAVLTSVHSVVAVHEDGTAASMEVAAQDESDAHVDELSRIAEGQITAVLVKPSGFAEANEIWRDFYIGAEAQAAFPGAELGSLFDLLNQGQEILQLVAYLAGIMAALTLFLAIYSAIGARERLLAIMRALGAKRGMVFRLVLFEGLLIALVGAVLGRILGYVVAASIARQLSQQSAIPFSIEYIPALEAWFWIIPAALGLLAGALPAWQAYRANILARLFPA